MDILVFYKINECVSAVPRMFNGNHPDKIVGHKYYVLNPIFIDVKLSFDTDIIVYRDEH